MQLGHVASRGEAIKGVAGGSVHQRIQLLKKLLHLGDAQHTGGWSATDIIRVVGWKIP